MKTEKLLQQFELKERPGYLPCKLWTRAKSDEGYGRVVWEGGNRSVTHVVWYLTYGVWPTKQLNHHCDNAACFEITHLYDGTQKQNRDDASERQTTFRSCGHARVIGNAWTRHRDGRIDMICKTCRNANGSKRR